MSNCPIEIKKKYPRRFVFKDPKTKKILSEGVATNALLPIYQVGAGREHWKGVEWLEHKSGLKEFRFMYWTRKISPDGLSGEVAKEETSKLESICRMCGRKFINLDHSGWKKPTDDPRIVHLREDHGLDVIRLGDRFETKRSGLRNAGQKNWKWGQFNLCLTKERFNELIKTMKGEGWLR